MRTWLPLQAAWFPTNSCLLVCPEAAAALLASSSHFASLVRDGMKLPQSCEPKHNNGLSLPPKRLRQLTRRCT
jgi:hypothetical protein